MTKEYTLEDLKRDLVPVMKRMPSYAKLITKLSRDPRISRADKAKLIAGIGYMASPIDLIPGLIPVLGQLDDVIVALITLRSVLSANPAEIIEPYLIETGLSYDIVEQDIATAKRVTKDLSITIAKKTGRGLAKAGRYIGRKITGGS